MKLRYTGDVPVVFVTAGLVEPGGTFDVKGRAVDGFLQRGDVRRANLPAGTPDTEPTGGASAAPDDDIAKGPVCQE